MERGFKAGGHGQPVLPLHERPLQRAPHWALLPFLVGVLIGLAVSTVILFRPQAASVSVYVSISNHEEPAQKQDYRKLLDELRLPGLRLGGGATKLREEVDVREPVFYAVVLHERHSASQVEAIRATWAKGVPWESVAFFVPPEESSQGRDGGAREEGEGGEEEEEEAHYGEIETAKDSTSQAVLELPHGYTYGGGVAELLTLRHLCKHKLNSTKWFFIASGDVYVKTRALEDHLQPLENLPQFGYLGKPVRRDPVGRVCLPGPGSVLSHAALSRLCPHLQRCVAMARTGMFKTDCVVGECLASQLNLQCYKSSQVKKQSV